MLGKEMPVLPQWGRLSSSRITGSAASAPASDGPGRNGAGSHRAGSLQRGDDDEDDLAAAMGPALIEPDHSARNREICWA